jgi:hypothetical protein
VTVDGFEAVADLSSSTYKAKLTHENLSDGRHKLTIDRGTAPVIERIKGYAIWVKPEAGVTIPGDTKPDKDGWYLLSDSVTLTGEYNIEFKALSTYDVRVNFTSNISGETFTKYITDKIERAEIAPPTPTNFTVILNSDNRTKRFSWQLPKSTYTTWKDNIVSDIKSYVLRYINTTLESATDAAILKAWDQAIALDSVSGTRTWFETTLFATSGENTILLRASDQTGWVSDKVVFITVNLVDKLTANVVNTVAWNLDASTNEYINCEVTDVADLRTETGADLLAEDSNVLQHTVTKYLKQVDPAKDAYVYWRFDNDYIKSRLTITTTATATTQHRIAALTGVEVALADESGNELQTEAGDSLNKTDLDYSAIEVSKLAASVFHPYSSGEELTEDIYGVQTLVRSTDGTTPGEISAISYTLDYPDVLENFNDVSVVAAGTQIPLTKTFRTIKSVQVTIQDIGTGAVSAKVLAKTTTYVTVQVLNAAGTGVVGSVDVTVQGY